MQISEDALDGHLENWARWLRSGGGVLGYPHASVGITPSHNASCEEGSEILNEINDRRNAAIMDVLIWQLPPAQCAAIHVFKGINATFRFPRENYNVVLREARDRLAVWADEKGLV